MNRRTFLAATGLSAPALWPAATPLDFQGTPKAKIAVLATNWGFQGDIHAFCAAAKKEGYDGIEMWWQGDPVKRKALFEALSTHGLKVGYLCGGHQPEFDLHLKTFESSLKAASTQFDEKPLYINCHSGKDYFSREQNQKFIDLTTETASKTGIKVCHETHRGRMLFAAPVARQFLTQNPDMRLTLDISHWCNVHEGLLADQKETVEMALQRVDHIHARVGHAQGPQVNDPRAPEWKSAVDAHLSWWDAVVARKSKNNETITFLTEFGPPDYFPTLPYTRQPVSNQWEINVYMMKLLRGRYEG